MKVMVVDDEEDTQLLFQQRFRRELRTGQIEFHFAFSAEAALADLEQQGANGFRLLLSDINMPGMSGLELLRRIKEKYHKLKVFMISAYQDAKNFETAKAYGCDGYFVKPLNFEELRNKLV